MDEVVPPHPGYRPAASSVHYTSICNTQSSAPEDGRNYRPKHVELIGIINKTLLLHLVGCLYYCISDAPSYKHQNQHFVRFLVCLVPATYLAHLIFLDFITLTTLTLSRCFLRGFLHYSTVHVFQIPVQQLTFDVRFLNNLKYVSGKALRPKRTLPYAWLIMV